MRPGRRPNRLPVVVKRLRLFQSAPPWVMSRYSVAGMSLSSMLGMFRVGRRGMTSPNSVGIYHRQPSRCSSS